ncbi:14222_t:CDS:1, partial [Dentiscutata heterogama]
MTTTQAYFGPYTQIYTNETNFEWNRVGFLRPDLTQQVLKLQQKRVVLPVTSKAERPKKEQEFLSIQNRALGELKNALEIALSRFDRCPPMFKNDVDNMSIAHVRSCFDRAIKNLHSYCYEYQNSPKAPNAPKSSFTVPPKAPT